MKTRIPSKMFDLPPTELIRKINLLADHELDTLSFGSICLARDGIILAYSDGRRRFSGLSREDVLGRSFFDVIAPGARCSEFHEHFRSGALESRLDVTFLFTFRLPNGWRAAKVRMVSDQNTGLIWVLIAPRAQIGSIRTPTHRASADRLERIAS